MNNKSNISLPSIDTSFSNLSFNTSVHNQGARQSADHSAFQTIMSSPTHKNTRMNPFTPQHSQSFYSDANSTMGSDMMDNTMNSVLNTPTAMHSHQGNSNYWNHRNITAPIIGSGNNILTNQKQPAMSGGTRGIGNKFTDYSFTEQPSPAPNMSMHAAAGASNTLHKTNTAMQTMSEFGTNNYAYDKNDGNEIKTLKMDLRIKNTQIESLEQEIQSLKKYLKNKDKPAAPTAVPSSSAYDTFQSTNTSSTAVSSMGTIPNYKNQYSHGKSGYTAEDLAYQAELKRIDDEETYVFPVIPKNLETIINKLAVNLEKKETELQETKDRLECIMTAIVTNPSPSLMGSAISNVSTKYGRYDVETLAHKMVVRLEILTRENQEMAKMLSYGKSKEYETELELLRRENAELKERLDLNNQ